MIVLSNLTLVSLSANMFLFCFHPWPYILNMDTSSHNGADIFSIAVQVFLDLFWKKCLLFGQMLITCLKCFRASFLLSFIVTRKDSAFFSCDFASSYSEKCAMDVVVSFQPRPRFSFNKLDINVLADDLFSEFFFALGWEQLLTVIL